MKTGDIATDFDAVDQSGARVTLTSLLEAGPVVLFFYPKAFTPGCTAESCHFRDLGSEFAEVGAQRVGISADSVDDQSSFAVANKLDFPLLSDPDRSIARIFGVKRPGPLFNRRKTFVIDQDRRVLMAKGSEMNMETHANSALEVLRHRLAAA